MSGLFGGNNSGVAGVAAAAAPSFTKGNAPGVAAAPTDGQFTPAAVVAANRRQAALQRAGQGGTIASRGQPAAVGGAYGNRTLGGGS